MKEMIGLKTATETCLPGGCRIFSGSLPPELADDRGFEELWSLHPTAYNEAVVHGRRVKMPRWVRAYEKDYPYSNQTAKAEKAPPGIRKYLDWSRENIDQNHNGLLVNWHDGAKNHHHGKHRDSEKGLIPGISIITISLGEERVFRMRLWPDSRPMVDFVLKNGDFIIIPWQTNQLWTHEVPKFARYKGRRVSVTIRAFE